MARKKRAKKAEKPSRDQLVGALEFLTELLKPDPAPDTEAAMSDLKEQFVEYSDCLAVADQRVCEAHPDWSACAEALDFEPVWNTGESVPDEDEDADDEFEDETEEDDEEADEGDEDDEIEDEDDEGDDEEDEEPEPEPEPPRKRVKKSVKKAARAKADAKLAKKAKKADRKAEEEEADEEPEEKPKRKRGRPKKVEEPEEKPKKKRGRPRKNPEPEPEDEEPEAEEPPKKKRGRPKKEKPAPEPEEPEIEEAPEPEPEPEVEKPKKKVTAVRTGKYTRIHAVADYLRTMNGEDVTQDELVEGADAVYVDAHDNTRPSNLPEALAIVRRITQMLETLGILELSEDKTFWTVHLPEDD